LTGSNKEGFIYLFFLHFHWPNLTIIENINSNFYCLGTVDALLVMHFTKYYTERTVETREKHLHANGTQATPATQVPRQFPLAPPGSIKIGIARMKNIPRRLCY
jgi:hypothetical protein